MFSIAARWRVWSQSFGFRCGWRRLHAIIGCVAAAALVPAAEVPAGNAPPRADFMPAIQLAPFVVKGEKLSISILARTKADRRYAEKFAEDVIEVTYAALEKSPGAGLVIIGEEGEPHPVFVFRKFVEMARAGQLDPAIAARAAEAGSMMRDWEQRMHLDEAAKQGMPLESFLNALPLPLEGVASKLYQLAWAEGFDEKRVEQKLRTLTPADLAGTDQLARFDWVFYLPPREAAGEAIKKVVPVVMKKEKMGFFKRAAVRSAMVVMSPAIRKGVEAARKGMMFMTVLRARSGYSSDDINDLTRVYVRVLMPDFKFNDSTTRQRAIEAVEAQKVVNAEHARNPFVSPPRLAEFDPAAFARFEGSYGEKAEATNRLARSEAGFTWQYRDQKPRPWFPAGDRLLVSENGKMTLGFLVDEAGVVTGVEERGHRRRKTLLRTTSAPSPVEQREERPAGSQPEAPAAKP